ncbi:outer membrane lipoprotein carrier protein LolA [Thioclava atlantica]|uniref:Outer membrane lipoprotein carrier protein LolA n=2 Tax=Thioclava atlantica TaxID=1317124 RepID=A0A085TTG8_9RHOB|nr:outer membrane lipoprotein carrier protein LolA [Thioclava atlantica]
MGMKQIRILLAAIFSLALALPASAAKLSLAEISAYLNSLQSASSDFTQVNSDGSVSTGKLFIKRPGRARFQYDNNNLLVLASANRVAVFDPKSNQPPEQYPLTKTPLNLILARQIDLSRSNMVTGYRSDGSNTIVTAQDPQHPEYGTIQLVFSEGPVTLKQWVITDESGQKTSTILKNLKTGGNFGQLMFSIDAELARRR